MSRQQFECVIVVFYCSLCVAVEHTHINGRRERLTANIGPEEIALVSLNPEDGDLILGPDLVDEAERAYAIGPYCQRQRLGIQCFVKVRGAAADAEHLHRVAAFETVAIAIKERTRHVAKELAMPRPQTGSVNDGRSTVIATGEPQRNQPTEAGVAYDLENAALGAVCSHFVAISQIIDVVDDVSIAVGKRD